VQAIQEYSREAKQIFDNTAAPSDNEVIVLAEDLVQYALEVAETYSINKRFAGFIDYKRVRWIPSSFGLFPQVLLADAKASTENNRETLQQSQLPLDADFLSNHRHVRLTAGIPPHLDLPTVEGNSIAAITTSAFIHFYYEKLKRSQPPFRNLKSIFALLIPNQVLKPRYNPTPEKTFFGQGKHSPARGEVPRIRVYFSRLRTLCPWRLQELRYRNNSEYTDPIWRDWNEASDGEILTPFEFLPR
jgi:hypothetical protein